VNIPCGHTGGHNIMSTASVLSFCSEELGDDSTFPKIPVKSMMIRFCFAK